jgi:hypothetical protein
LVNRLSGTKGRAVSLAAEIGARSPQQRAAALRDVVTVMELRETYGPGWQRRMLSLELPTERLLPVAEQLRSLQRVLETTSHGLFWGSWLRQAPAAELRAALSAYEQGLGSALQELANHGVWSSAVQERNLNSLRDSLNKSRQNQALLADVETVACWARAAGIGDSEAMLSWLRQVQSTMKRAEAFPQDELNALLAGGLSIDQIDAVLTAAERTRALMAGSGLTAQVEGLMAADQTALSQSLFTLQNQLAPLVQELMGPADLLPADANQQTLQSLARGIQESSRTYQALLQQWQDAGLKPEATLAELMQLPVDLALAHRRREETRLALASFWASPDFKDKSIGVTP